jgi:hypothetical protein
MPLIKALPNPINAVCDTNVFYGLKDDALIQLKSKGLTLLLSPLNVYEVLGVKHNQKDNREFGKRRAAAARMLKHKDGWIVDPEVWHCERLGCSTTGYGFRDFEEALLRMSKARTWTDVQRAQNYVNTDFARKSRDALYGAFEKKVNCAIERYKKDGHAADVATVRAMSVTDNWAGLCRDGEFNRAIETCRQYQGDPKLSKCLVGTPNAKLASKLHDYAGLYVEYMINQIVSKRKVQPNDFGDLQFGIYGCGGLLLVTRESLWQKLAVSSNLLVMPI